MSATRRLGAYVLAADPTWMRSSLARYYGLLDRLVVSASASDRGWTGKRIRASECTRLALEADPRGIARVLTGDWNGPKPLLELETDQRQAAVDALSSEVDWVLQIDPDEVLPNTDALLRVIDEADRLGVDAVEWPMRLLYRRLRDGRYLQVATEAGEPHIEFPGPIAVRAGARLAHARHVDAPFLRPYAPGQENSLQLHRVAQAGEIRLALLDPQDAILHNSWARSPGDVRAKIASWGHNQGWRSQRYYFGTWLPTPLVWRTMRDFHPFSSGLWPRLSEAAVDIDALVHPDER